MAHPILALPKPDLRAYLIFNESKHTAGRLNLTPFLRLKSYSSMLPTDEKSTSRSGVPQGPKDLHGLSKDQLLNQLANSPCADRTLPANVSLEEYLESVAAENDPPPP